LFLSGIGHDKQKRMERVDSKLATTKSLPLGRVPQDWEERIVFVPLAKKQEVELKKAMKEDETKRHVAAALVPYQLDEKKVKSSVMASFGTRFYKGEPNPKMDAMHHLIEQAPNRKFFVFSSVRMS
jgi:hypothetical protein